MEGLQCRWVWEARLDDTEGSPCWVLGAHQVRAISPPTPLHSPPGGRGGGAPSVHSAKDVRCQMLLSKQAYVHVHCLDPTP